MTLREAYSLADYWVEFPPLHEIGRMFAGAYLGWKPKAVPQASASEKHEPFRESSLEDIQAFVAAVRSAGG